MKNLFCLSLLLIGVLVSTASAQEVTAGQSLATQATWSALSNRIGKADAQQKVIDIGLKAVQLCQSRLRFYAPNSADPAKDANGCVPPPLPENLNVTTGVFNKFQVQCDGPGFACRDSTGCGCYANAATAKATCKRLGYSTVAGYTVSGFNSPKNNTIAYWNAAINNFTRAGARDMGNARFESLSCYNITRG